MLSTDKYWINYNHLYYFMVIAEEQGVAKAAVRLRLGQSTLSTQLAQFEENIGIKLFDRRQKRLHLTEAGGIALQYSREVFRLGSEMIDTLHDRKHSLRISVQIGALDSIPKSVVVEVISKAQEKHLCSISVVEGHEAGLLRMLKTHQIDLAIFDHPPGALDRPGIKSKLVDRNSVEILGSAKYSGLRKNFPDSLQNQPFIMPGAHSRLRHDVDQYLSSSNLQVDVVLDAQDTSLLTLLASKGSGLIPVGASAANEIKKSHNLISVGTLAGVFDELWFVVSERQIDNPVAASLFKSSFKSESKLVRK